MKLKPLCKCGNGKRIQWKGVCQTCYSRKAKEVDPDKDKCLCDNLAFKMSKGSPVCERCDRIEETMNYGLQGDR